MGISGFLGFIIGAQRRETYCHSDSYPTGLGQVIVNFILGLKPEEYAIMNQRLEKLQWVDPRAHPPKELQEKFQELGFSKASDEQRDKEWYWVLRNVQGGAALPEIFQGNLEYLTKGKFADGYFPDFSYYIDFQEMTLETWMKDKVMHKATFPELAEAKESYMEGLEKKFEG